MFEFRLKCDGVKLSCQQADELTTGSSGVANCVFAFDENWDGFIKTAIFCISDKHISAKLDDQMSCNLPQSESNCIYVGVVGVDGERKISSTWVKLYLLDGISDDDAISDIPTKSVWEQYILEMEHNLETSKQYAESSQKSEIYANQYAQSSLNSSKSASDSAKDALVSQTAAENAKTNAEESADNAIKAQKSAETAETKSQSAKASAESAAGNAKTSEINAQESAQSALASEQNVSASIDDHNTSETAHEDIRKDVDSKANKTDVKNELLKKENTENKGNPNGYAPLDSNGKLPEIYLYGKTVKEYGVRWKGTSSTACERLGDAIGLTANAHLGNTDSVQNDFDSIYPWCDMKLCNIDVDGNVLAYSDEPTFAKDGTNGDVMVEIPKFYYRRNKTAQGYEEWWICSLPLEGYQLHPLFINDGAEVSKVYHSAYNISTYTDENDENKVKAQSITGVQPKIRVTRANFRTYARNKGTYWGIEDVSCMNALQMLYLIEYANTNSQLPLGSGVISENYTNTHIALEAGENTNSFVISTTNANRYKVGQRIEIGTSQGSPNKADARTIIAITVREDDADVSVITFDGEPVASIAVGNMIWNVAPLNGSCDTLNGGSGYIGISGYADTAYRGIEGFHGKLFRFIDGVNINDRVFYYSNSNTDYADGTYTGKYKAVGYTNSETNGYVSAFGYDPKAPWVMFPTASAGGSSTYVPDYYYQSLGERLLLLGGYFNIGPNAGVFYFSCSSTFSISYLYCGAHLLIKKP